MKTLFLAIAFLAVVMLSSCGPSGVVAGVDSHRYYGARPYYYPRPFYNPFYYRYSHSWGRPHHRAYYH